MPLPVLTTAKYETVIPSTGKRIEFRPFLVKEEKILLLAQDSGESDQIIRALKDIIHSCTFEKVNVDDLAIYDLEYLFLQLRAKSVGEIIDLQVKCKKCEKPNQLQVNLNDVNVKNTKGKTENKIELTDTVGIMARPIPVKDIGKVSDKPEDFVKMIALCIESIYDDSNVYNAVDVSEKELLTFVESLSRKQVEKIEAFISNQPKIQHSENFVCHSCSTKNTIQLEGLQDFFK